MAAVDRSTDTYIEDFGWASDFLSCFSLVPIFFSLLGSLKGGNIQTSFKPRSGRRVMRKMHRAFDRLTTHSTTVPTVSSFCRSRVHESLPLIGNCSFWLANRPHISQFLRVSCPMPMSRQRSCNWSLCYDRCGWKTWSFQGAAGKLSARWSHRNSGWVVMRMRRKKWHFEADRIELTR